MKIGDRVTTPEGPGLIVNKEKFRESTRFGVRMDKHPEKFNKLPLLYFFVYELTKIRTK